MKHAIQEYWKGLQHASTTAWNRFWFTPSDLLPVCLLRVLVGGFALLYVLSFSLDLVEWFGRDGLLPRETVLTLNSVTGMPDGSGDVVTHLRLSYFYLTDSAAALWAMHAVGVVVVAMFTLGIASRITNILSLVVVLSYVHRGPMIAGHAEPLLAMLLFYLCFAPTGARLSIDRLRMRQRGAANYLQSVYHESSSAWTANLSVRMIQVHTAMFCSIMGLAKLSGQTWWIGEAMWILIAQADSRLVDLSFLRDSTYLINAWSHFVVIFELTFPVLIWNRWLRPLMLAGGLLVWLPLMLVTGLLSLFLLLLIACVAFVPAQVLLKCCHRDGGTP